MPRTTSKRPRDESVNEGSCVIPRQANVDKIFIRELIRESECITAEAIKNAIIESEEKHFDHIADLIKKSEEKILSELNKRIDSIQDDLNVLTERVNKLEINSSETKKNERRNN